MEVLESGTPIWASPHREKAQKILNKLGVEEVLGVVPIDNSAHKVGQPNGPSKHSPNRQPRTKRKITRD